MGIFRKSKEPVKLVPANLGARMYDAFGLDPYKIDAVLAGSPLERPEWVTEEELAQRRADEPSAQEILEELEQDPDVQAILAASDLAIATSSKESS